MTTIVKFRRGLYPVWTTIFFLILFLSTLLLLNEKKNENLIVATVSLEVTADTSQIFAKIFIKVFPKGFTFSLYMTSIMKF